MKTNFKAHAKNLDVSQAKLDKLLFGHHPSFLERLGWPLIIAILICLIVIIIPLLPDSDNPPSSDQTPVISADPDSPLLSRSTARGVAAGRALQFSSFLATHSLGSGFKSVFTGLALGQHHPASWLPFISFQGISIGSHLGLSQRLDQTSATVLGVNSGQSLGQNANATDPNSKASLLTQVLREIREPLAATTFFRGPITDPPSEINYAKAIFTEAQRKALQAITETRQLELDLKTKYDRQKALVEALSDSLSITINQTVSSQVSGKTQDLQEASAFLASLKAQFEVFQKLETDLRSASTELQKRLDYIDKNFQNLALGLCDWQTC